MTKTQLENFIKLQEQIEGMFQELSILSKKNPDKPLNKFKIKLVNSVLDTANSILDEKNRPFTDFERFDEDELPSNSDVVVMLSQYLKCLEKYRSENIAKGLNDPYNWYWVIDGKQTKVKTKAPQIEVSD